MNLDDIILMFFRSNFMKQLLAIICLLLFLGCKESQSKKEHVIEEKVTRINMVTNHGNIGIVLYNETPFHRDNFIKLIQEKAYDSLLFHRVIENFMIQGGDPDSHNAEADAILGEGDRDYTVKAEFHPDLFHKILYI